MQAATGARVGEIARLTWADIHLSSGFMTLRGKTELDLLRTLLVHGEDGLTADVPTAGGIERRTREVKVRIPAGVDDGQRIRLRGKGGAGRNGGPPGDLYVVVDVQPHEMFGRSGKDLTITIPVTFPEAALGATVKVPTLDASTVSVKVPPGTRPGKTFRVRGRGVETPKGVGDLLVTIDIVVPQKLSKKEREAIEALAEVTDWSPRDAEES